LHELFDASTVEARRLVTVDNFEALFDVPPMPADWGRTLTSVAG